MAAGDAAVDLEVDPVGRLAAALARQAAARVDVAETGCLAGRAERGEASRQFPRQRPQYLHARRIAMGAHVRIEHCQAIVGAARW